MRLAFLCHASVFRSNARIASQSTFLNVLLQLSFYRLLGNNDPYPSAAAYLANNLQS